jgi:hypothetical protein
MAYNSMDIYKQRAEAPRDHKDFESKYEARIEDSREYRQYSRRMPYYMWDGKLPPDADLQVVPMKAVHLTSENLERLIRDQDFMGRRLEEAEYDRTVVRQLRADERVRDSNPAVQKAYRNYQMLLELARQ